MTTESGPYKIKIFAADHISGNGSLRIAKASNDGSKISFYTNETIFNIHHENPAETYSAPTLVRVLGPSIEGGIADPFLSYTINGIAGSNLSWTGTQSGIIAATTFAPPSTLEPAVFANINEGLNTILVGNTAFGDGRAKTEVISITGNRTGSQFDEYQVIKSGVSQAWVSYDVSSGVTNKKLFAYSISMMDKISGSGLNYNLGYYPGISIFYSGETRVGFCTAADLIFATTGYCKRSDSAEEFLGEGAGPAVVCLTSGITSGALREAVNSVLTSMGQALTDNGQIVPGSDAEQVLTETASNYTVYNGYIKIDGLYSGDQICFSSYNFDSDYSGTYLGTFGSYPPYPQVDLCWTYPTDFTGAQQLTDKINSGLYSGLTNTLTSGYNLWYKELRITSNDASGYFESGSLLRATFVSTGRVNIESSRIGSVGNYRFTITSGTRPSQKPIQNVQKFLLPDIITVQGANTYGVWTNLDSRTGINWGSLHPDTTSVSFSSTITGITGVQAVPAAQITSITGIVNKQLVYTAIVSGVDKCGFPFSKEVDFYVVNTGLGPKACSENGDGDDLSSLISSSVFANTGIQLSNLYSITTGFSFNNQNEYNYYRLVLSNFAAKSATFNQAVGNEFYVSNIALFGYTGAAILQSGAMNILGASYTGRIQGLTTGIITGTVNGVANASGVLDLRNYIVTGIPNGNGFVKFQHASGFYVTPFSGALQNIVSGTGFYTENVNGFFYESGVTGISFSKPVSGYITGSGNLSGGPYNIITDAFLAHFTGTQHVTGTQTGIASGIIPDFTFISDGIPSFITQSGSYTGSATSGYFTIITGLSANPTVAYQFDLTGTNQSRVDLIYNSPQDNDTIFINNIPIIFNSTGALEAPTYFKTIDELTNIINSGSGQFLMTGINNGSIITLRATALGVSGDGITTSTDGSAGAPTFSSSTTTGGANYYRPVIPTGTFTGSISITKGATGFFVSTGHGNITGVIKQLNFIRYFTGIWNLFTGDFNFRDSGWFNTSGYSNTGFSNPVYYYPTPNNIPITISYSNDPSVVSTDLANLIITGYNYGTGLTLLMSGKF